MNFNDDKPNPPPEKPVPDKDPERRRSPGDPNDPPDMPERPDEVPDTPTPDPNRQPPSAHWDDGVGRH